MPRRERARALASLPRPAYSGRESTTVDDRTRGMTMNRCAGLVLLSLACVAASTSMIFADAFDGMVLTADKGTGGVGVALTWTGGQPTFRVYRSTVAQTTLDPANQIGTTDVRSFNDTPPSGAIFYYEIKSPCVYNPPEICNGIDDDCDGTIDGPGSEASCQLPHATAQCVSGACAVGACDSGFGDCDTNPANGCESDLTSDSAIAITAPASRARAGRRSTLRDAWRRGGARPRPEPARSRRRIAPPARSTPTTTVCPTSGRMPAASTTTATASTTRTTRTFRTPTSACGTSTSTSPTWAPRPTSTRPRTRAPRAARP